MKNKSTTYFWIGFLVTVLSVAFLYWLWQQKKEVAPKPLIVNRRLDPKPVARVAQSESESKDYLEKIRGIGPLTARRLNEAGIFTYAQLAAAGPEEISEIIGLSPWDPAQLIADAEKLAGHD